MTFRSHHICIRIHCSLYNDTIHVWIGMCKCALILAFFRSVLLLLLLILHSCSAKCDIKLYALFVLVYVMLHYYYKGGGHRHRYPVYTVYMRRKTCRANDIVYRSCGRSVCVFWTVCILSLGIFAGRIETINFIEFLPFSKLVEIRLYDFHWFFFVVVTQPNQNT